MIWAALGGHQADLAHSDRRPLAARYQTDVAWFAAVADLSEAAGADLASQCAAGEVAILFRDRVPSALAGFDEVHREQVHQMVAPIAVRPDLSR
ncbi:MAG: hypothetical protein HKN26_16585 [Acidimicrobiales bacterium]|nr:hypothetical protein [Acidimicrobiales bacterium]